MNGKIFLSWTFFLLCPLAKRKNIFSLMFYIKTKAKQQGMTEIRGLWPGTFERVRDRALMHVIDANLNNKSLQLKPKWTLYIGR